MLWQCWTWKAHQQIELHYSPCFSAPLHTQNWVLDCLEHWVAGGWYSGMGPGTHMVTVEFLRHNFLSLSKAFIVKIQNFCFNPFAIALGFCPLHYHSGIFLESHHKWIDSPENENPDDVNNHKIQSRISFWIDLKNIL